MLFNTHIRLGNYLHAELSATQAAVIGKHAFVYGNVKPDLIRKGPQDRHVFSVSQDFLLNVLTRLTTGAPTLTKSEGAVLLGVLCHHISDLFCRYHHDPRLYPNLRCHFQYEVGLHRRFLRLAEAGFAPQATGFVPRKADDLMQDITAQLDAYNLEEPSFDLDIRYAMHNCTRLMEALVPLMTMAIEPTPLQEPEFLLWRDAI